MTGILRRARTVLRVVGALAGGLLPLARARGPRRVGTCGGCLAAVFDDQPHDWYRGEVFHRDPCVKISPAATAGTRPDCAYCAPDEACALHLDL